MQITRKTIPQVLGMSASTKQRQAAIVLKLSGGQNIDLNKFDFDSNDRSSFVGIYPCCPLLYPNQAPILDFKDPNSISELSDFTLLSSNDNLIISNNHKKRKLK